MTQLDTLPKTMLFYNGGATLTTEDSDSLEDLKSLEAQGVEIMTCGTCLDYYGLKDKLAVEMCIRDRSSRSEHLWAEISER